MITVCFCHHKGNLIDDALRTLYQRTRGVPFETIIMTSDIECLNRLQGTYPALKIIVSRAGPATKRNAAMKLASFDLIAYFDDDTELTETSLSGMLEIIKNPNINIGMVFGKLLNFEHPEIFDEAGGFMTWTGFIWARGDRQKNDGKFNVAEPIFSGKSAACLIKKNIMIKAGLFDESFGILGEESDLAWRVWRVGYQIWYAPQSVTFHKFNTRFKPLDFYTVERVYRNGARNYLSMLIKNAPLHLLVLALPIQISAWLACSLGHLIHGNSRACRAILAGLYEVLFRLPMSLNNRKHIPIQTFQSLKPLLRNPPLAYFTSRLVNYVKTGLHG